LIAYKLGELPNLTFRDLNNLLLKGVNISPNELDLGGNRSIEMYRQRNKDLGLGFREAERHAIGVQNGRSFRKNVDDLFAHDEGVVVENAGNFDIVLGNRYFAIVKDLDKGEQSWDQWELEMR
jgi:hypothetical protein